MGAFRRRWPGLSYGRGEDWHIVGAVGEPAFQNSWTAESGYMTPGFRIREAGVVDIYGKFKSGSSGTVAFTLPVGYRPNADVLIVGDSGYLAIGSNGNVTVLTSGTKLIVSGQFFLDVPDIAP